MKLNLIVLLFLCVYGQDGLGDLQRPDNTVSNDTLNDESGQQSDNSYDQYKPTQKNEPEKEEEEVPEPDPVKPTPQEPEKPDQSEQVVTPTDDGSDDYSITINSDDADVYVETFIAIVVIGSAVCCTITTIICICYCLTQGNGKKRRNKATRLAPAKDKKPKKEPVPAKTAQDCMPQDDLNDSNMSLKKVSPIMDQIGHTDQSVIVNPTHASVETPAPQVSVQTPAPQASVQTHVLQVSAETPAPAQYQQQQQVMQSQVVQSAPAWQQQQQQVVQNQAVQSAPAWQQQQQQVVQNQAVQYQQQATYAQPVAYQQHQMAQQVPQNAFGLQISATGKTQSHDWKAFPKESKLLLLNANFDQIFMHRKSADNRYQMDDARMFILTMFQGTGLQVCDENTFVTTMNQFADPQTQTVTKEQIFEAFIQLSA